MSKKNETAYGISARIVRRGLVKVAEVSITDGQDTWTFDSAESFTIKELKARFPYFNQPRKKKQKPQVPILPGQLELINDGK